MCTQWFALSGWVTWMPWPLGIYRLPLVQCSAIQSRTSLRQPVKHTKTKPRFCFSHKLSRSWLCSVQWWQRWTAKSLSDGSLTKRPSKEHVLVCAQLWQQNTWCLQPDHRASPFSITIRFWAHLNLLGITVIMELSLISVWWHHQWLDSPVSLSYSL